MKIIVCVKQVPDTSGKVAVNPDGTLNRASMQTITNPDDMNAVEAALKLKDHPLIDATTIGLKGSPTNIFKSFTPPQKGAGKMLEGAGKETCEELASILAAKHII